jgi:hypothetical protein
MMDFVPDDLFLDLDLVGDPLGMPIDGPPVDAAAGPEWYSDMWFTDLDPGLPDAAAPADLPLPDPFQAGTGLGVTGMLGKKFSRKTGPADAGKSGPSAQTVATLMQIADTSVSLAQRLKGMRKKEKPAD